MKKSLLLLLLTLPLQADVGQNYSQIKAQGEKIETFIDTTYKHPKAKKVGDKMPLVIGREVSYRDMRIINIRTGKAGRKIGLIVGYDRNGDEIPEYEFVRRFCDAGSNVETYAVLDVPHKKFYIDSSRNKYIDAIVDVENVDPLKKLLIPMIPLKCEHEQERISV